MDLFTRAEAFAKRRGSQIQTVDFSTRPSAPSRRLRVSTWLLVALVPVVTAITSQHDSLCKVPLVPL